MSRSKDSDSLSKASTLNRFREGSERDFDVDFNEDLDLSYSKFSHVSGVSIYQCSTTESPFVQKIHNKINNIKLQEIPPMESHDLGSVNNDNFNMYPIPETLHEHNERSNGSYKTDGGGGGGDNSDDNGDKFNDDNGENDNNENNLNDIYVNNENIENNETKGLLKLENPKLKMNFL